MDGRTPDESNGVSVEMLSAWLGRHRFDWDENSGTVRIPVVGGLLWWRPAGGDDDHGSEADLEIPLDRGFLSGSCAQVDPENSHIAAAGEEWELPLVASGTSFISKTRTSIVLRIRMLNLEVFDLVARVLRMEGAHSPFTVSEFGDWTLVARPLEWRRRKLSGAEEAVLNEQQRQEAASIEIASWRVHGVEWKPSPLLKEIVSVMQHTPGLPDLISKPEYGLLKHVPFDILLGSRRRAYIVAAVRGETVPAVDEIVLPALDISSSATSDGIRWWQCRRCHRYLDLLDEQVGIVVSADRAVCPCCGAGDPMTVEPVDDPLFKAEHEKVKARILQYSDPGMKLFLQEAKALIEEVGLFADIAEDAEKTPAWAQGLAASVIAAGIRLKASCDALIDAVVRSSSGG